MGLLIEFVGTLLLLGIGIVALIVWALRGTFRRLREEWDREGRVLQLRKQFLDEQAQCRTEAARELDEEGLCQVETEDLEARAARRQQPEEVENKCH